MGENIVTAEFFYSNVSNFAGIWLLSVTVRVDGNTIYMKKAEIPVEISNGSRHSVWEASENMGCLLRWCIFSLFCLLSSFEYTL